MKPTWMPSAFALIAMLGAGGTAAFAVNCGTSNAEAISDDDLLGVNNALGLGVLVQHAATSTEPGKVLTTLNPRDPSYALRGSDKLVVRIRQGKITETSQKELNCDDVAVNGVTITSNDVATKTGSGKTVYQKGPEVTAEILKVLHLFDDPAWADGTESAEKKAIAAKGVDPIVEACVVGSDGKPRAKLQTNLAYAWDEGTYELGTYTEAQSVSILAGDAGAGDSGTGTGGRVVPVRLTEGTRITSQIGYAQLCEQELGEIPFFPKEANGKYSTFDCRDGVVVSSTGTRTKLPSIEGGLIPVTRDGVPVTACDPSTPLGIGSNSYDCLQNTDSGMFLASGGVQPGPTVYTAKNSKGAHWILLCRKVADDGNGMLKSKKFNDMAMIGNNPKNGKTCFFQNSIGSGTNGAAVPNPADPEKSTTVWSASMQTYCTNCHNKSAFVHSRWIDGALRANGKSVVPKLGENPDYIISKNDAPYYIVNQDAEGFKVPPQIISDEAAPCGTCHRVPASTNWTNFTNWSTGSGAIYMDQRSATGKKFEYAHWMPMRLEGLDETNWASSQWAKAVEHINLCGANPSAAGCLTAPIPRGNNRAAPR